MHHKFRTVLVYSVVEVETSYFYAVSPLNYLGRLNHASDAFVLVNEFLGKSRFLICEANVRNVDPCVELSSCVTNINVVESLVQQLS